MMPRMITMAPATLTMIWIILHVSVGSLMGTLHGEVTTTLTLMADGTEIMACH